MNQNSRVVDALINLQEQCEYKTREIEAARTRKRSNI
jgi:hypothetical protein